MLGGVGAFASGFGTQVAKDAVLEPLWGENKKSSDGGERAGQIAADIAAIGAGGALAVTQAKSFLRLHRAQPEGGLMTFKGAAPAFNAVGKKTGAVALALLGVGILAAGIKNLGWGVGQTPPSPPQPPIPPVPNPEPPVPPVPNPEPPTNPKPPTNPEPPTNPKPPVEPPQHPPIDPHPHPKPPDDPYQGPINPPHQGPIQLPVHTVKPGEFLTFIADCNGIGWRELYWENKDVIGSNPDLIRAGMQLRIPLPGTEAPKFPYTPSYDPNGHVPDLVCDPVQRPLTDCK